MKTRKNMTSHAGTVIVGHHRAFTLIELLVVITIIGLLASILFPVFGRARESARRSSCQSNLKQMGLGMMQYTQDYDESYPCHWWDNAAGQWKPVNITTYWESAMYPYVKSSQIYVCPSQLKTTKTTFPTDFTKPTVKDGTTTYIKNYFIMNSDGFESARPVKLAMIPNAAGVIAVAEMNFRNLAAMNDGFAHVWNASLLPTGGLRQGFPHFDGANYLFCDGHVKWLHQSKTAADTDECARLWGRKSRTNIGRYPADFVYGG